MRSTIVKVAGSYYWKEMSIEEFKIVANKLIINMDHTDFDEDCCCIWSSKVQSERDLEEIMAREVNKKIPLDTP
jgi:hypothetical protein